MTRALFINSGILGQKTFARFIQDAFVARQEGIRATQIVLTEQLTPGERLLRRMLCLRLSPNGGGRLKNLDLQRYRAEWNAGLLARRRIRRLEQFGEHFDVLHFHRQATAYASLARIRATPTIISIDCTQRCVLQSARSRIEASTYGPNVRRDGQIFRAARLIVSTSRWAANCLHEEYPDCATDVAIMPNPVQLESFDAGWIGERFARAVQVAGYQPRVLFMGGDFRRKGGFDLLSAWRDGQLGRVARLDLVTSWRVEPAVLSLGVHVHTGVAPHSPEWRALWREADVFALPTRDEAFGMAFQEAAAAGLPAIGTRINAVPEVIDEGASGFLVEPGDRDALVRLLNRLISNAELRRDMGARARAFIVGSAHPDVYRGELMAAIQTLARK